MLSPCLISVNDFPRCFAFYGELMTVLGHQVRFSESDWPRAGWQQPGVARPLFGIASAENGQPAAPGDGQMLALLAQSRAQVDAAHAAGLAAGGTDAGAPGLRPQDHANFYGAYLRDPDDTKIGLACHAPGP
jgi:catechol 2,3-dioxygenase-like lactoylglutathione lyase family enzyme